jgi:thiol-disulfide isomerase/thioredoxin
MRMKLLLWTLGMTACIAFGSSTWAIPGSQKLTFKIGDRAPAIEPIAWLHGDPVTKYEPGRVYVVEFWATWCPPCIRIIPHLSAVQKKYVNTVTVVGVNADGLLGFEGNVDKVHVPGSWTHWQLPPRPQAPPGQRGHMGSRSSFPKADAHVLRLLEQTGRAGLPSHQVRDDEDEFAHVERFRQVSLIAGDKGALSILCPRKRSESQRGNPIAPRFIGAQFPD